MKKNYLPAIYLALIILSFFVSFYGIKFYGDTILPPEYTGSDDYFTYFALSIGLLVSLIVAYKMKKMKKYCFREMFWGMFLSFSCFTSGVFLLFGILFFLVFGVNIFWGDEVHEFTNGKVLMVKTHKSGRYGEVTKADIYIPKFNRHYERTLDSNHKFTFGQACVVEYHKGALGLYYIDDVQ